MLVSHTQIAFYCNEKQKNRRKKMIGLYAIMAQKRRVEHD